jgi:protease-4
MGDVAASGGYYIAAPADLIFAEPSTTTGSIGIFGYKLDVSGLASALSLKTETYRRGTHADALSPFRPWTPDERVQAEKKLRHLYDLFLNTVARGRQRVGLTVPRVDELGRGRVYTGAQAKAVGLVDELGGLTAAIDRASQLAGLAARAAEPEGPELLILPRPETSLLRQAAGVSDEEGAVEDAPISPALRPVLRRLAPYLFGPGEGVEARLPFDIADVD